ncbi:MAG: ATP-dependent RecD-like DNA helicase [Solobacterium sp.]|nr:ATP-dependent RecD-like DNA helicase [Solobacterium sp.]
MTDEIILVGKPEYILFRNDSTFYTVMKFRIEDEREKLIIATGILPDRPAIDFLYRIYGNYVEHPKYGMQFKIEMIERPLPNEADSAIRYLCGVQFPGIGKKTAQKIVSLLGDDCLNQIREDPSVLYTIPGLSEDKIEIIRQGIQKEDEGMGELVRFLNVQGVGMRNLVLLNRVYGASALQKLKEDPYRVIEECDGFGFRTADRIAMTLGFEPDDERRLTAMMSTVCMNLCVSSGDSYCLKEELFARFRKEAGQDDCDPDIYLSRAAEKKQLVIEENRIYPVSQYESEQTIASFLKGFPYVPIDRYEPDDLEKELELLQKKMGMVYDPCQTDAIRKFFESPFMILTGGPGTGKTTVVKAFVTLFRTLYPGSTVLTAAPTGRAAKRLAELTDSESMTIHSMLKWDLETNSFGVTENEPLSADLLIIDEFSMVDDWLFANLLKASYHIRRICVIGDEDQLPSVSPGSVLRDLIACEQFPLVRLDHIHRQKQGSDVISLAHQIARRDVDFSALQNDVRFFDCPLEEIRRMILQIVDNALEKGYSMNDVQVISPTYKTAAGIDVLNNALQECFNPPEKGKREIRVGYMVFRVGDKILQLKNQPDDDVYNGDIGILESIEEASETENHQAVVTVRFEDIYVDYSGDTLNNISLAYCISVHKSQGSEYPIVVMPVSRAFSFMLQRKLLYTGCTRARQSLVLLGDREAFMNGISAEERHVRRTTLKERICNEG